ncbi:hypothetical protein LXL04_026499 [Taraxacum kok-saghyz]
MADSQQVRSTTDTSNNLPVAIVHCLPSYKFSLAWTKEIVNTIEPSDPLYPIHSPSARAVIVIGLTPLKSEHLDQYPSVECVFGTSAGVDHIDLVECRRRNIRVASAGDAFSEDVADYAIGLLIDVLRQVSASDRYVRSGLWPVKGDYPLGNKVGGKRVGIVGLGRIGTLVAKRLEPFGCTIGYTSRTKKPQVPYQFHSTVLDLATNSDALILCCSFTEKTRHVIDHDVMKALGKRGIIVNIGRGALMDEKELVKLLTDGELGGAGLDVFENEPEVPKELFTMDNVVLSPHRAVASMEAMVELVHLVATLISCYPSMADSQKLQSTAAVGSNLPYAIIHRLPNFQFSLSCVEDIVNLIEPSDPQFPIHGPSARVVIDIGPSPIKLEHFDQYPSVEYILGTSAGVDHIDLDECRRRNIRVTSAGDAFSEDGADYAIGLLLDVLRRVSASDRYVRAGLWPVKGDYPLGNKLGGKRVGIVGLGNIGTLVAKRLEPFGCTIGYTSRTKKPQVPYQFYSTVLDLATNSDALIICCSLTEKTRHVINHDVLTALGKKGIIVNVGRGALVDEKELVKLLVGGELGGAGLDVFENEPDVPKELVTMHNVVLSPHKAILTPESFEALRGGACGYGNTMTNGYGTNTAALSSTIFSNGYACGQCYQIKCVQSPWCSKGVATVTATNICPPNWSKDSNKGGWCNPPRTHFDMAKPAFMQIAQWKAGIVPVVYRRVPCVRKGGLRFSFQGNGYWLLVYVMNVGGAGDIKSMWVKGTKTGWLSMSHNWGVSYQAFATLRGQALSFRLTSYTTKQTITAYNVAPANWNLGLTYQANCNFH